MPVELQRVGPDGIGEVHALLAEVGRDLHERYSSDHWDPPLPLDYLTSTVADRHVMGVRDGDELVATFTVGLHLPDYYDDACFPPGPRRPAFLNRLAVRPRRQGAGIGRWCMSEAEARARSLDADVLRLDTALAIAPTVAFYRGLGYVETARRTYAGHPTVCLQKLL